MEDVAPPPKHTIENDLGTFEGFNFRAQAAIAQNHTAQEILDWNHDTQGEAEFWPAGDNELVLHLFEHQSAVSASDLVAVDSLLSARGEDGLLIGISLVRDGYRPPELTEELLDERPLHLFEASSFIDARAEAAWSLFELYWPETFALYESNNHPDGLVFDEERFLESPQCAVTEIQLSGRRIVVVALQ